MIYEFEDEAKADLVHASTNEVITVRFDGEALTANNNVLMEVGKSAVKRLVIGITLTNPDTKIPYKTIVPEGQIDPRTIIRSVREINEVVRPYFGFDSWESILEKRKKGGSSLDSVLFHANSDIGEYYNNTDPTSKNILVEDANKWLEDLRESGSFELRWLTGQLDSFESTVLHFLIFKTGASGISIKELDSFLKENDIETDEKNTYRAMLKIAKLCSRDEKLKKRFRMIRISSDNIKDQARFLWGSR